MSDLAQPINLRNDFPPVATADWESTITKDLKGADYDKKLKWRTDEGLTIKPYYRAEDAAPPRMPLVRGNGQPWEALEPDRQPVLAVDATEYHDSGATAVQEVAWALASAADLMAADQPATPVGFAVGSNYFLEIAKLRAFRILMAQVSRAFGQPEAAIHLHCRTANANKTIYDPYVNLLRVTTEALSAVVGGCDSLTVAPARFDPHLALNVQRIIREESGLDKVADPSAGSYYVDSLTDDLARLAWQEFQSIESAGGFNAWKASGTLDAALAQARAAKEKAIGSRRRTLVGTNNYPNVQERELAGQHDLPAGWRLAMPFEAIRLRTERHAQTTGKLPRVLLLERGDLKMRKARATFCQNFFGCAGFEILQSESLTPAELVVLCSSDAEYAAFAADICSKVQTPVVVAGYPKDQIETLKAAGVTDFVHVLSNAVEVLPLWQDRLGVQK